MNTLKEQLVSIMQTNSLCKIIETIIEICIDKDKASPAIRWSEFVGALNRAYLRIHDYGGSRVDLSTKTDE